MGKMKDRDLKTTLSNLYILLGSFGIAKLARPISELLKVKRINRKHYRSPRKIDAHRFTLMHTTLPKAITSN